MANYMKSKTLDELQFLNVQDFNIAAPGSSHLDKRMTPFDVAQRVSILGTYELPFGRGKRFGSSLPRAEIMRLEIGSWAGTFQASPGFRSIFRMPLLSPIRVPGYRESGSRFITGSTPLFSEDRPGAVHAAELSVAFPRCAVPR